MAYSTNPNLPRARALGLKLLLLQSLSLQTAANKCGVHRTTIWRWKQKWLRLNEHQQLKNVNRPHRQSGTQFRLLSCTWLIPTLRSRPRTSPTAIGQHVIDRVLELRRTLKRCAEVVWHHLLHNDGIRISLSSVRRILKRNHELSGRRHRVRHGNPKRPLPAKAGELVQTDTIHYVCPFTKRRRYVYTVIDLYSRMAYAEVNNRIGPGIAARVITRAQNGFGFTFAMVQADNGPEFRRHFEDKLRIRGILSRHSRLHRPNDNAHIERFNRTIQEECLGRYLSHKTTNKAVQERLSAYLDYYNQKRVHLSLQCRTPNEMLQRS